MATTKKTVLNTDHLPYADLKDGILETWKGTLISAFSLQAFDIECSDQETINQVGETIKRLLNELSPDFTYRMTARNEVSCGNSNRHFDFWIELQARKRGNVLPFFNSKVALEQLSTDATEERDKLSRERERVHRTLKQLGISARLLNDKEILRELRQFFRPETTLPIHVLSTLRQADLLIKDNLFFYDHVYWAGLSVAEYPDSVKTGQMISSLLCGVNNFTSVIFKPCDSLKVVNQLKQRRKISASLTNTYSRLRDVESEAKLQSEDDLLESLVVGQEKVFECQVSSFVCGLDPQFIELQLSKLADQYRGQGYQVYREALALYSVFGASLPGGQIESSRSQLLPSSCAQALLPIFNIDKGHDNRVLEFTDRFGGKVGIDPWDSSLPSYNSIVSGTSGSGKSFLSNVLLKRLTEDPEMSVFIIEIGGSYRRLTKLKEGQFFNFDLHSSGGFNPFGHISKDDPSSLEAATEIISTIIGEPGKGITKLERNIILKEINEILGDCDGVLTLSLLRNKWTKSNVEFLRNAAQILYGWTEDRPFGRLLDNTTVLQPTSRWTCFDLKGLNDFPELQRVVMLAIVKRVWELVRSSNDKKILLLDEVWALVQNNTAFIGEAFRTFRKHNASAIAVTQSIEDIATESLISAVLNNAPTKIVLKQSLRPERLQKLLDLNQRELEIVGQLRSVKGEFSEFFMINGDRRRFLKLEPTAADYWLATTNPHDLDFISKFLEKRPELNELQACNEIANLYGRKRP